MGDLTDMVGTIATTLDCYVCKRNYRGMFNTVRLYEKLESSGSMNLAADQSQVWADRYSEWNDHIDRTHITNGFYFGTHPGDGADFGVWMDDEHAERIEAIEIRYTATKFVPDDSDTNVYGEDCEPGHGEHMVSGWVRNPSDPFDVDTDENLNPEDIDPIKLDLDTVVDLFDGDVDKAIRRELEDTLGAIDSFDGLSAYASDPIIDYRSGVRVILAGHVSDPLNPDPESDRRPAY
jgi:hypothetical protein